MTTSKTIPAALALAAVLSCRSTPPTLHELYRETLAEMEGAGGVTQKARERNAERYEEVRRRLEAEEVQGPQDYLYAAGVLSTSNAREDLELARQLATHADELGEPRGRVLIAETTDRILLQMGGRQHYGTQVYLNVASGRWELYPFDPSVTDADREYMGLPSLAQMLERIEKLNRDQGLASSVLEAIEK